MKPTPIKLILIIFILAFQIQLVNYQYLDLVPTHIFLSFFIAGVSSLFLIVQFISKNYRKSNWTLLLTAAPIFGFVFGLAIQNYQNSERKENAEKLISALTEYDEENGEYPQKLSSLTPGYIETIPKSHWGFQSVDFDYTKDTNRNEFAIQYDLITGCSNYYHSSMKIWQFSD